MHPLLNIAIKAARNAGNVITRYMEHVDNLTISTKSRNDFVSEVDHHAEKEIIGVIRKAYPDHSILAEESGSTSGDDTTWIIDPLDGTTNYLHGFPQFSVSIAVEHRGKLSQAVVYDPLRQELFTASRGAGAQLDNRRIRVSKLSSLEGALLGTGFPFKQQKNLDAYLETFKALFPMTAGIRRAGSAALDIAYVAAGRLDGFWEIGLKPWDMAAGILLVEEAGGIVSDMNGNRKFLENGHIICGNPRVYEAMLTTISPHVEKFDF